MHVLAEYVENEFTIRNISGYRNCFKPMNPEKKKDKAISKDLESSSVLFRRFKIEYPSLRFIQKTPMLAL